MIVLAERDKEERMWIRMLMLEVRQLLKRFGDRLAIDHVNLDVGEGQILGLLGPNGAGKTTTIRCVTGLMAPDSGVIRMQGKNMAEHEMDVKRQMGVVPQDLALFEDLSAYENATYFGQLYGLRGKQLKSSVEEALAFTGLLDRTGSPAG
jgi:ABC-2 type transport system ATP-binding protein